MLSLGCKASIKAVIFLSTRFDSAEKPGIMEIAEFIDENEHTVGKLLQKLVKEGNINSSKGPGGGFYLTAEQNRQPLMNIIETIDGGSLFKQCGLGLMKCSDTHPCPIHNDYKIIRDLFENLCRMKTVHELHKSIDKGLTHLIA